MCFDKIVHVHGRDIGFGKSYDQSFQIITLPIIELKKSYLYADNKQNTFEWILISLWAGLGLFMTCGGICMILDVYGFFYEKNNGDWFNIGIPGIFLIIMGLGIFINAYFMCVGYHRLVINKKNIAFEYVKFNSIKSRIKSKIKRELTDEDFLTCELNEDAYDDFYSVSLALVLPKDKVSITLFFNGVLHEKRKGMSFEKALNINLQETTKLTLDKAKEIEKYLNIRIFY